MATKKATSELLTKDNVDIESILLKKGYSPANFRSSASGRTTKGITDRAMLKSTGKAEKVQVSSATGHGPRATTVTKSSVETDPPKAPQHHIFKDESTQDTLSDLSLSTEESSQVCTYILH